MLTRKTLKAYIQLAQSDASFQATLTTERDRLLQEMISNPESAKEIISGSGNGTSFTADVSMTKENRIEFLQVILDAIIAGQLPPSQTYARFC